jgi:hypothetical protein
MTCIDEIFPVILYHESFDLKYLRTNIVQCFKEEAKFHNDQNSRHDYITARGECPACAFCVSCQQWTTAEIQLVPLAVALNGT